MKLPSLRASFRSRLLAILISIGFGFTPAQAQLGKPEGLYYKSWGVVIGIENYLLAPKIPGAIEDAKAVAQVLTSWDSRKCSSSTIKTPAPGDCNKHSSIFC